MTYPQSIPAAELLGFRLCTGQCLLGLEDECHCRCGGRWHAVLADAEIPIPVTLTLAEAVAAGPAGLPRRRSGSRSASANRAATPEAAELHYAAELAEGRIPSVRQVKRDMRVGQGRAYALQQHLERVMRHRLAPAK